MNLHSKDRLGVIKEITDRLKEVGEITNGIDFLKAIVEREELESTAIGAGVAVPHGRTNAVRSLVIAFGRSRESIDFNSIDGQPIRLIFLLASPDRDAGRYLKAVAKICTLSRQKRFRESLIKAENAQEIITKIREAETTGKETNAST